MTGRHATTGGADDESIASSQPDPRGAHRADATHAAAPTSSGVPVVADDAVVTPRRARRRAGTPPEG